MGGVMSMIDANWPPKAKWSTNDIPDLSGKVIIVTDDIPDLSGKVIIVTGGNSGIGKETVKALLFKRAKVYIASHNEERANAAIQELEAATNYKAHFLKVDLASLRSVKAAAEEFRRLEIKLDVLINNACVLLPAHVRRLFLVYDIPDLSGKVIIVTGGNSGIGKETVKALLFKRAKVYIASHNEERANAAIQELEAATNYKAHFLKVDLASLRSVKAAAEEFRRLEIKLDVLINNAGVMIPEPNALTAEGYDLQFGVNVIGHFYFTQLLIPLLVAAGGSRIVNITSHGYVLVNTIKWDTVRDGPAPEGYDLQFGVNVIGHFYFTQLLIPLLVAAGGSRIVNITSHGYVLVNTIKWDTVRDGPARQKMSGLDLYNQSKLGNVVFARELARRYGDKGIVSTFVHPGRTYLLFSFLSLIVTNLGRTMWQIIVIIVGYFSYTAAQGALTPLWAATSSETANANGKYLIPWARFGEAHPGASDPEAGLELWTWLEQQTKDIH
ncbi:hypothetical protein AN958_06170 [Leucoagaricus sp. SymC.cos]|nr:hypothetical protein AN958_06170 [Leucoagaricus sp. SymC.cos]